MLDMTTLAFANLRVIDGQIRLPGGNSSRVMENVGLAFGLTFAGGSATMVGAAVPFFTSTTNKPVLAAALGLSAGVMLCTVCQSILDYY